MFRAGAVAGVLIRDERLGGGFSLRGGGRTGLVSVWGSGAVGLASLVVVAHSSRSVPHTTASGMSVDGINSCPL